MVNGTSSYFDSSFHADRILTERFLDSLLTDFSVYKTPKEQMHIAYLLSITKHVSCSHNELYYTKKNLQTLANWISQGCSENVYAFSEIVNDLINYDIELHKKLTKKVNWNAFFQSFSKSIPKGLYAWGRLINRLTYAVNIEDKSRFANKVFACCAGNCAAVQTQDLPAFSCFLSRIYHLNPELVSSLLLSHIMDYRALWVSEAAQIVEVFDFEFLAYVCGECGLIKRKPTKEQAKVTKSLVSSFPIKEIATFASNSRPRHWHTLYNVFLLIKKYNRKKLLKICELIDLKAIDTTTKSFWEKTDDDLFYLCHSIALSCPQKAEELLLMHKSEINKLCLPLIEISPKLAIELSRQGVQISLVQNNWWELTFTAIDLLITEDRETADKIILENDTSLAKEISSICVLDLENSYILKSIQLISKNNRSTLEAILRKIDLERFEKSVRSTLLDSRTTRMTVSRLHELIEYCAPYSEKPNDFLKFIKLRRPHKTGANR